MMRRVFVKIVMTKYKEKNHMYFPKKGKDYHRFREMHLRMKNKDKIFNLFEKLVDMTGRQKFF